MMKSFIFFLKDFFFKMILWIQWMQFWQSDKGFSCPITGNDPKKVHKRCKNYSKKFSWNCSHGEVESSLKAPLTFLNSQPKYFRSKFKKITICRFCKRLAPKSLHWNWESSFDNSATFFARIGQKNCSVSKND